MVTITMEAAAAASALFCWHYGIKLCDVCLCYLKNILFHMNWLMVNKNALLLCAVELINAEFLLKILLGFKQ